MGKSGPGNPPGKAKRMALKQALTWHVWKEKAKGLSEMKFGGVYQRRGAWAAEQGLGYIEPSSPRLGDWISFDVQ